VKQTPGRDPEVLTETSPAARTRPRWRGVSHQYAFFAALAAGIPLIFTAPSTRAAVAAAIYVASLAGLLGTSALYHRIMWSPRARYWMGQIDTSMIFVLIAGSFTPLILLLLQPPAATVAFRILWAVAGVAIAVNMLSGHAKKAFSSVVFVVLSSAGAAVLLPQIVGPLGATATTLFAVGGFLYILGAAAYGLQRPDPFPQSFGYHEIFHALVVVAAGIHFVTIAVYVLPA